jgi:guanylate kinase
MNMTTEKKVSQKGKVFVVSSSSGAGKTTIVTEVIKRLSKKFPIRRVITYTTRTPRNNEINGKDYYFLTHEEFENKRENGFFLETTEYNGKLYGSPASIIPDLELGKSFIFITDIPGVKSISKLFEKPTLIWISAPSLQELKERIISRGTESVHQMEERLKLAEEEIKEAHKSRLFDFNITNDHIEPAIEELELIITKALAG